eukprot:4141090-Pleurochrysis_carterae.AAC.1
MDATVVSRHSVHARGCLKLTGVAMSTHRAHSCNSRRLGVRAPPSLTARPSLLRAKPFAPSQTGVGRRLFRP